jgi:prepilin-type N-terminal cleavage/methylation domain-containing protein
MGFTLIEALVAMAILSAALVVSYSTISNALRTTFRVAERRAGVEQVQQQLDLLRQQPFLRPQIFEGETTAYKWRVSVEAVQEIVGKNILPFRIIGRLTSKSAPDRTETVMDTILAKPGA